MTGRSPSGSRHRSPKPASAGSNPARPAISRRALLLGAALFALVGCKPPRAQESWPEVTPVEPMPKPRLSGDTLPKGTLILCHNGHYACVTANDIRRGDIGPQPDDFRDWAGGYVPKRNAPLPRCRTCGGEIFVHHGCTPISVSVHTEGGLWPPVTVTDGR